MELMTAKPSREGTHGVLRRRTGASLLALVLLGLTCSKGIAASRAQGEEGSGASAPDEEQGADLAEANRRLRESEQALQALRKRQLHNLEQMLEVSTPREKGPVLLAFAKVLFEAAAGAGDVAETFLDDLEGAVAPKARQAFQQRIDELRKHADGFQEKIVETLHRAKRLPLDETTRRGVVQLLARAHKARGQGLAALKEYRRLVRRSPMSPEGREAAYHLGEHALEQGEIEEALRLFRVAAGPGRSGRGDTRSYLARRKIGWCQLQGDDLVSALATFETLLKELNRPGGPAQLGSQVRSDYLYAMGQNLGFDAARRHLNVVWGRGKGRAMLRGLAECYYRDHRYEDALAAHRSLLGKGQDPLREALYRWRIVQGLAALGRREDAWSAMVAAFSAQQELREGPEDRSVRAAQVRILAEEVSRDLLIRGHDRLLEQGGQADKDAHAAMASQASQAVDLLQLYLELFPAAPRRWTMRLALGDMLYLLDRFLEASTELEAVFEEKEAGILRKEAGKGAALCLGAMLRKSATNEAGARGLAARLTKLSSRFLALYPAGDAAMVVRIEGAEALRVLGRQEEAQAKLAAVVDAGGKHAIDAAEASLAMLMASEEWSGLAAAASRFLQREELGDAAFKERMEAVCCKAKLRLARAASPGAAGGRALLALGRGLQAFAVQNPGCPKAPQAWLEAGRTLRSAGGLLLARSSLEGLIEQHPKSDETRQAALELASVCEDLADLGCAADALVRAAKGAACGEGLPLLLRAAAMRQARGDHEAALGLGRSLLHTCPDAKEPAAALFDAVRAAMRRRDLGLAKQALGAVQGAGAGRGEESSLAARLYLEAIAFLGGKQDSFELEGLLAEYMGSPSPDARDAAAAIEAVAALVEAKRSRIAKLVEAGLRVRKEDLEELAQLTAAIERWAATAASSTGELESRTRALVLAADGLQMAASAMSEVAQRVWAVTSPDSPLRALSEDAGRLQEDLDERSLEIATRALGLGADLSPWRMNARLLSGEAPIRDAWYATLPHLAPAKRARIPFPGRTFFGAAPGQVDRR